MLPKFYSNNFKGRDVLEDLSMDGRIKLKPIFKKEIVGSGLKSNG
jgi:hypothetical protein